MKKEFIRFLKVNRVYTRFVDKLKDKPVPEDSLDDYLNRIAVTQGLGPKSFISAAFDWNEPRWFNLGPKWENLCNKLNYK